MKLKRNRVTFALIALLLVGGGSAAFAVLTTPQPGRVALADLRQNKSAPTAIVTATTAATANATATSATSSAALTTAPAPQPTNTPFTLVPGQSVGLKGIVSNVNASGGTNAGTFTLTTSNGAITVNVSSGTNWSGDATDLSKLQNGWFAEVHGVVQANGSLLATEVNANSDN